MRIIRPPGPLQQNFNNRLEQNDPNQITYTIFRNLYAEKGLKRFNQLVAVSPTWQTSNLLPFASLDERLVSNTLSLTNIRAWYDIRVEKVGFAHK